MKGHRYRVTLEHIAPAREGQPLQAAPLSFETVNHDELFDIVEKVGQKVDLDADEAASLAIGLKLLGEVILRHRNEAPFAEMWPSMIDLITRVKTAEKTVITT